MCNSTKLHRISFLRLINLTYKQLVARLYVGAVAMGTAIESETHACLGGQK